MKIHTFDFELYQISFVFNFIIKKKQKNLIDKIKILTFRNSFANLEYPNQNA